MSIRPPNQMRRRDSLDSSASQRSLGRPQRARSRLQSKDGRYIDFLSPGLAPERIVGFISITRTAR
jgi:hypothetical protein